MRRLWAPLALGCLSIAAHAVWSQTAPLQAPLQAPAQYPTASPILTSQADVYSGPNTSFYPTSRLNYGDRVIVLGESKKAPGWLEIVPPTRSFSWIEAKYVKTVPGMDKIGIVDAGDPNGTAPILPGSIVANKEPNVEIARVKTGTQLFLLDRPSAIGSTTMYPISPVATEVRFVPASAVGAGGGQYAGNPNYGANPNPGGYGSTIPTGWQTPAGPATNPYAFIDLSKQGDAALASGANDRARLLYVEALSQTNDPAWRNYLTSRLNQATGQQPPQNPDPFKSASSPASAPNYGTPPAGPSTFGTPTVPPAANANKQWSPWGVLRTAPFTTREGLPMYVLENRQNGSPLMYVTTQQGAMLRDYVGQTICVYGTLATRNDDYIRMQYLVAEQVATPPAGAK